ncbi:NAD(P)H-binding protein [Streptomyces lunaelactis]|uniref:NmrA family NAD(P)-binding protein n=1 Tax=Streptomyces lunaelactis TaxID=1535768 RepID=UPI0015847A2F|nr:NmrA family NAD(P)-binding protein [Streptomyces lunaelactis]NUK05455.1 NAD(P)H-binding protein [Streptomyces lunaelactis]NUK12138.1 NAD(P)H-binding protein [Streptomyces lunaelactis]NUK19904.1 NAD(P)H-binding protein [Streptomyces lunaelactis]NUK27267.1 NAD(P)H-binding protein [Streptomyces lunaelactis]NUK38472.1 NAD(P)H-binding protein [Streptomyces lunaelactis]
MTDSQQTTLVLGGTGRTGSLVARKLIERGLNARTATRHGADVRFDWDDPTTHARALDGVDRVYLVTPVMRVKYAGPVSDFLDLAAGAGVRHVTYLSAYGSDQAPPEVDIRAVELDLARRGAFTHSILRPAWVMQNFSDEHTPVIEGAITLPTGGGAEAFVDAADIAAVAVETLVAPDAHAGAQYAPTGPQALTVGEVADIIADVIGGPVTHHDIDPDAWIGGAIAAGFVPADYAVMLRWLTGTIISGNGSRPNDDIEKVTGRPPVTFQDFARRNAAAWTLQASK